MYVMHEIKGKLSQSFKERFKNQEQERVLGKQSTIEKG